MVDTIEGALRYAFNRGLVTHDELLEQLRTLTTEQLMNVALLAINEHDRDLFDLTTRESRRRLVEMLGDEDVNDVLDEGVTQ